jgi:hypothetical protein
VGKFLTTTAPTGTSTCVCCGCYLDYFPKLDHAITNLSLSIKEVLVENAEHDELGSVRSRTVSTCAGVAIVQGTVSKDNNQRDWGAPS